ncbi:YheC/YheD family protein [Paenibacillus endoradicis]|uniref:YheC/YheD family protein n=1 Tax=Paenibacillus endoradicis TaxID=2972487 RepID=UPI00215965D8|nr:YheC/YheD family protein [Paenibacillus endoradicis]MCR8659846.1 YheC/YheD family protein [Paenibacillus endoradicis]
MTYESRTIKSKWIKTKWLLQHRELSKYVPHTMLFNKTNLDLMLSLYSSVYFKPTGGTGGSRIIRIDIKDNGYHIQYNLNKLKFSTPELLFQHLFLFANSQSYVLQKGINLTTINKNPFDIRIMVQKTNKGSWVSSAVSVKIGQHGKIVTNYHQGGTLALFHETMIRAGFDAITTERINIQLNNIGVATGEHFEKYYNDFKELALDVALDVALDATGYPWILEVNTRPQIAPLKTLKDQRLYARVLSYAKQYGRTK